jgi:hypothetical protein
MEVRAGGEVIWRGEVFSMAHPALGSIVGTDVPPASRSTRPATRPCWSTSTAPRRPRTTACTPSFMTVADAVARSYGQFEVELDIARRSADPATRPGLDELADALR